MSDIIHLLPDSIANQIAAGEVIQRPASVVKELTENAIDAGATHIRIYIKDAGRTLIQVIDDGKGMSETDARMAFERHATSKISTAADLFALRTMGFRGEALASIAAVAQVELRTRLKGAELGTRLALSGSELQEIEADACDEGSVFSVKNLFFNIPARRKFLKSNEVEFRHILNEFERIALVNPQIHLSLYRDETELFNLPASGLRQRIIKVCGKAFNPKLLPVDVKSSILTITGFTGRPDSARKRGALQFFFVNGRFMKHSYFHKALMQAYDRLVPAGEMPDYFIYFTIDPASIDVNIHPTKTEIKFENESSVWQILLAGIRESLSKSNAVPSIDFDTEGSIDIPVYSSENNHRPLKMPQVQIDPTYNPFQNTASSPRKNLEFDWSKLYKGFEEEKEQPVQSEIKHSQDEAAEELFNACYQYKGRYIITSLKSGLAIVDQHRAHIRILFDQYLSNIRRHKGVSQQILFPEIVEFTPSEALMLPSILEELYYVGFDISDLGNNSYAINGVPAGLEKPNPAVLVKDAVNHAIDTGCRAHEEICEAIALSLAKAMAIPAGKNLSVEEMNSLIASLFASSSSTYSPEGKLIVSILTDEELNKQFR
ncbi:MAG: DNA mismatch repair endonuclease MutL [Tannerellaceae bacterium]|jgi:DNA mismatch repair protein MutL|nr:DNA mismatch repair endonuclease MutL [Tannerellaceae bacterium]